MKAFYFKMKRQWNDKMAKACKRYEYQLQIIAVDFIAALLSVCASIYIYIYMYGQTDRIAYTYTACPG